MTISEERTSIESGRKQMLT